VGTRGGSQAGPLRVVLDTNVVVSALVFRGGALARLRPAWQRGEFVPLASRETLDELVRVLAYPKFALTKDEVAELLAVFLPQVEVIARARIRRPHGLPDCRDPDDRKFLELAAAGGAEILVTGDAALLELAGSVSFAIERPAEFLARLPDR
jgi:putative PIN family toxin of toxin-antitoxin system